MIKDSSPLHCTTLGSRRGGHPGFEKKSLKEGGACCRVCEPGPFSGLASVGSWFPLNLHTAAAQLHLLWAVPSSLTQPGVPLTPIKGGIAAEAIFHTHATTPNSSSSRLHQLLTLQGSALQQDMCPLWDLFALLNTSGASLSQHPPPPAVTDPPPWVSTCPCSSQSCVMRVSSTSLTPTSTTAQQSRYDHTLTPPPQSPSLLSLPPSSPLNIASTYLIMPKS